MCGKPPAAEFGRHNVVDRAIFVLVAAAALGSGIMAGIFYGFSSFVMKALARIAPEQGVAAMNSMTTAVINPSFMLAFMGTAVVSSILGAMSYFRWQQFEGKLMLAGALLYLLGSFGVTMAFNQPLNLKLGAMPPSEAVAFWPQYLESWMKWNLLRTAASLLSASIFVWVLIRRGCAA